MKQEAIRGSWGVHACVCVCVYVWGGGTMDGYG